MKVRDLSFSKFYFSRLFVCLDRKLLFGLFFILAILSISLSSCGVPIKNLQKIEPEESPKLAPIFPTSANEVVFNTKIKFINRYYSGLLVVARDSIDPFQYRAALLAKAGPKLFDIQFEKETDTILTILPQLDRKSIKKILIEDLRLLFDPKDQEPVEQFILKDKSFYVDRIEAKDETYHYYKNNEGKIIKIDKGNKNRWYVRLDLKYEDNLIPKQAFIQHRKVPFFMKLIRI